MASSNALFKSHEDYRRNKELEEARKAGLAPAAVDEEGKEINPHIPQYMSSAPWYLNDNRPSLKHQKNWKAGDKGAGRHYDRGVKVFQANKFRKGACENCGAMSHKTKDCMERPRSKGARWTGKHIAADEKVEDIELDDFDAKRDRWSGYDSAQYSRVIDMYEMVDQQKREMKKKAELEKRFKQNGDKADGAADGYGKVEKRVRTTGGGATGSVRNLRIREDTAKYLLNLDPSSAHYDPKSRSMREDPQPHKAKKAFAGDNFVRKNGDYSAWESLTQHQLAAIDHGANMHMQAAPSQAEILFQNFKKKKGALQVKNKEDVMERYGNVAEKPSEDALLLGQTESYVEYDAHGRVIRGKEVKARSRYEEDVMVNNHTAVWGSWWQSGQWGYACCHQTTKNSYCTGEAGQLAQQAQAEQMQANVERKAQEDAEKAENTLLEVRISALDEEKLKEALKKQKEFEAQAVETNERKRKYNSFKDDGAAPTEEEMEAYRMSKRRDDDPLADIEAAKAAKASGYSLV
eukprot:jgi/Astpho2/5626/e_gw1.00079.34.1_t